MRKQMVAGNWKMNLSLEEGETLIHQVMQGMPALKSHQEVAFCCPFTHLDRASRILQDTPQVLLGAQTCSEFASGAHTGEISTQMLKACGVKTVIIGHSERRQNNAESHAILKSKVDAVLDAGLQLIFCCGEPLEIRENGGQNDYVLQQLKESLFHVSPEVFNVQVSVAYEPIWAIGTGRTASAEQAQDMHAFIRQSIAQVYSAEMAGDCTLLYGGSCQPQNAAELFACPDVDGGLIGGASLKSETFLPIIEAMYKSRD